MQGTMHQVGHPHPQTYQIYENLLPFLFYTTYANGGEDTARLSWKQKS